MLDDEDETRAFFRAKPLLDALNATIADGAPRRVALSDHAGNELSTTVFRSTDGCLKIDFSVVAFEAGEPLRHLARQMAAETDTATLLEILCNAGAEQCAGT